MAGPVSAINRSVGPLRAVYATEVETYAVVRPKANSGVNFNVYQRDFGLPVRPPT